MRKLVKFPGLLVCGCVLCAPPALAQQAGGAAAGPREGANPYAATAATPMETRPRADVAAASPAETGTPPVVNPPDPQNAGTLAENARTTALATYPWSTADIWFGRR